MIRTLEDLHKVKSEAERSLQARLHIGFSVQGKAEDEASMGGETGRGADTEEPKAGASKTGASKAAGLRTVVVCGATGCHASDSDKVLKNLDLILKARGLSDRTQVIRTGCFGFCEQGPIVKVEPDNVFYVRVGPKDVKDIVDSHLLGGTPVERLLYEDPHSGARVHRSEEMGFYKKQRKVALKNCGIIDPEDIREYIGMSGYEALGKALLQMTPERVIETVKRSGLRGRGGAGFPTGKKWEITRKQSDTAKYIICNADEGDPGAFMDRSILEGDPHSVLEAMAIGGYAIGASEGIVYIRAEYPQAVEMVKRAIGQAEEYGMLGDDIFGSGFNFHISIRHGAGAFVCGEETALINSCEGKRGEPNYKPPFPAEEGYWGHPTCVNNVETFANIPSILIRGAEWFSSIGTEGSKGTKVFALTGKINNTGLVEVPMGTTLREIIFDIGGGIPKGKKFKAVQTGGPSGGLIAGDGLDTPIDYDSLQEKGTIMGSGGMIIMDEDDNMVNIAKFYLEFTMDEACGRCSTGRIGTKRLHEMLEKVTKGEANRDDLEAMKQLAYIVKNSSLCGLCQTAPNPVISTMKHFWNEYEAFLK